MKKKPKAVPAKKPGGLGTIFWFLSIAVAALGIFLLPWYIPYTTRVIGESYALGFNNRIGILALGLSIFLGALACWFGSRPAAYAWLPANPQLFPPWSEASIEYLLVIGFSVLMGSLILFWSNYLADPAWCEARGFMYGMDLSALGQVPYRDFMYNYGPATLYLPIWLSRISGGLLSFEQSYAVTLALFTSAGFVSLYLLLRSLELPRLTRPLILGLGLVVWLAESMGLQYTPLRFLIVSVSLIFLNFIATRQSGTGLVPALRIGLAAAIAVGACLAISPEMGIASTVAVLGYGFILILRRSFQKAVACLLGAVAVFALTLVIFPGYLDSVFAFSSGGSNFPIYPTLHNLCMVAVVLIVLPPLIVSALSNPAESRAPLALALAVAGGMLLPAAFGRCDPGHVGINGLVPLFMMFPAAAAAGKVAFRAWIAIYAILWVIFLQYSYWTQYIPNFNSAIAMHESYKAHPEVVASWKTKWDALRLANPRGRDLHWSKVLPFPDGLSQLTSRGRVLLASWDDQNYWLARFLLLQNPPPHEYFDAYSQGASTPAQIATKIQQDLGYRFLMMPQSSIALVGHSVNLPAYQQGTDDFLSRILLFPVTSEARNQPYLPDTEYVASMLNYYKPIGRYNSYVILEQTSSPTASALP